MNAYDKHRFDMLQGKVWLYQATTILCATAAIFLAWGV